MTYEEFQQEWYGEHNDDSCDEMEENWADYEREQKND